MTTSRRTAYKSAITGLFVSEEYAEAHPDTTYLTAVRDNEPPSDSTPQDDQPRLPKDGEISTCGVCGGVIRGWTYYQFNGTEDDLIDWGWSHEVHPEDEHEGTPEVKNDEERPDDSGL